MRSAASADLMVTPSAVEASRSFDASTVAAGGQLTVTVTAAEYGQFGQVVETVPVRLRYSSSTSLEDPPWISGRMLGFSLFGEESFTYTVTVSRTLGDHDFSGVVKDEIRMEATVEWRLDGDGRARCRGAHRDQVRRLPGRRRRRGHCDDNARGPRRLRPGHGDPARQASPTCRPASPTSRSRARTVRSPSLSWARIALHTRSPPPIWTATTPSRAPRPTTPRRRRRSAAPPGIAVGDGVVTSDGGNVMLIVTPDAQSTYFKGRIIESCEAGPEGVGDVALCAIIDAWDAAGAEIVGFSLDAPSMLKITLSAEHVTGIGGDGRLGRLHAAGGVKVLTGGGEEWTEQESTLTVGEDGSATLSISITDFGGVAVAVDQAALPATGAMTPPGWLFMALALMGAAMIPTGILVLRRRSIEA